MAHGDRKPDNVLISKEGAGLELYDFDGWTTVDASMCSEMLT